MTNFCSKCGINWASLWSSEKGDETYEFCPQCGTDAYLQPGTEQKGFIKCPFTGKITNVETKAELIIPFKWPEKRKEKAIPAMTLTEEEIQRKDLAALQAYHESGKPEDFFNTYRNFKS